MKAHNWLTKLILLLIVMTLKDLLYGHVNNQLIIVFSDRSLEPPVSSAAHCSLMGGSKLTSIATPRCSGSFLCSVSRDQKTEKHK